MAFATLIQHDGRSYSLQSHSRYIRLTVDIASKYVRSYDEYRPTSFGDFIYVNPLDKKHFLVAASEDDYNDVNKCGLIYLFKFTRGDELQPCCLLNDLVNFEFKHQTGFGNNGNLDGNGIFSTTIKSKGGKDLLLYFNIQKQEYLGYIEYDLNKLTKETK